MFSSKKPFSSVTVAIERLTSEQFEDDDLSGIPDLVEAIKIQATGPAEAARALRKKLKYGNFHRQLRALTILDGLIQNAGSRFQRTFVDEPLLERLRVCGTSDLSDPKVRERCKVLFAEWTKYKKTAGLERIAGLYKELPKRKQTVKQETSRVLRETERDPFEDDEDNETPRTASSSKVAKPVSSAIKDPMAGLGSSSSSSTTLKISKKDTKSNKSKAKPFNLEAEKAKMKTVISESTIASINLLNALQLINREQERVSENAEASKRFEQCKILRRHVLRYIQHVESEQWLGALINSNDNLVQALMTFEQLDRSIDADSDSEDEIAEQAHMYRMATAKSKESTDISHGMGGLSISLPQQPPRPAQPAESNPDSPLDESDDDENDPFGDSNAVYTPAGERGPPSWKTR